MWKGLPVTNMLAYCTHLQAAKKMKCRDREYGPRVQHEANQIKFYVIILIKTKSLVGGDAKIGVIYAENVEDSV